MKKYQRTESAGPIIAVLIILELVAVVAWILKI